MSTRDRLRRLEKRDTDHRDKRTWVIYPNGDGPDGSLAGPPLEAHPEDLIISVTFDAGNDEYEDTDRCA